MSVLDKERILIGGGTGSGKTHAWLTIAQYLPNNTFHVIDPDLSVLRVWENEFPDVKNIRYHFTPEWFAPVEAVEPNVWKGGVKECWDATKALIKSNDWVVLEMMDSLWSLAISGFVAEIFGKDIGEYFMQARKAMTGKKGLEALGGWTDWNVINKNHNDDFVNQVCYKYPVHVVMTTAISVTSNKAAAGESSEVKAVYGDELVRLGGQKNVPYRAQSIFLLNHPKRNRWTISTYLKDRSREWFDNEELFDFGIQYIFGKAGWSM